MRQLRSASALASESPAGAAAAASKDRYRDNRNGLVAIYRRPSAMQPWLPLTGVSEPLRSPQASFSNIAVVSVSIAVMAAIARKATGYARPSEPLLYGSRIAHDATPKTSRSRRSNERGQVEESGSKSHHESGSGDVTGPESGKAPPTTCYRTCRCCEQWKGGQEREEEALTEDASRGALRAAIQR